MDSVFFNPGLDPGSRVQFHRSPRRVTGDLQETPVTRPEDTKRRAEEARLHPSDALFQEKKFDCETAGEAGQLTQAPSPA